MNNPEKEKQALFRVKVEWTTLKRNGTNLFKVRLKAKGRR